MNDEKEGKQASGEMPAERDELGPDGALEHNTGNSEERIGEERDSASSDDGPAEGKDPPVRHSGGWRRVKRIAASLLIVLCLIVGLAGGAALYAAKGLSPMPQAREVHVSIPKGATSSTIAELLEKNGIIHDAFMYRMYLRMQHQGSHFQAGEYAMHPGMTLAEITGMLNEGKTVKAEVVRFTIPEGYTVDQIADVLVQAHAVDKQKFLQLAAKPSAFDAYCVVYIPKDDKLLFPLEGYLFPETYEVKKGSTEADIINRMLLETDRKLSELPSDWKEKLAARHLTVHQMLTVASLIEREVVVPEERPIVAGVIYNRLAKGMPLQIDATVEYALGKHKDRVLTEDTKIDSPYNTYQHTGLPPGPIASPSLSSIKAALDPEKTDYYYYVTKKDGSHKHLFAKTYQEHLHNIAVSKQTAQQSK